MVEIIERKDLPTEEIVCPNCGSKLRYSNVDLLHREHHPNGYPDFYIICPVCEVQIDAHLVPRN